MDPKISADIHIWKMMWLMVSRKRADIMLKKKCVAEMILRRDIFLAKIAEIQDVLRDDCYDAIHRGDMGEAATKHMYILRFDRLITMIG